MVALKELVSYTDTLLDIGAFRDYCPNGLQVQGCAQVRSLVGGVSASRALIEAAIERGAQALLVHHGYFWRGEDPRVTGMKRERLALLLGHGISLLAYHLPLDAHPEWGNNVQLGRLLGFEIEGPLDETDRSKGLRGRLPSPLSGDVLRGHIAAALGREPLHIAAGPQPVCSIGWCTGAAQGFIETAIEAGLDAYLSGEVSEPTVHAAREGGIHYLGAGHHATERYGVQALGRHLAQRLDLEWAFIDIPNPA
jgi:dinuclear metal center YbgI/SA1388 family protein